MNKLHVEPEPTNTWCAYFDPEPGALVGRGNTREEAVTDLLEQTDEKWSMAWTENQQLKRSLSDAMRNTPANLLHRVTELEMEKAVRDAYAEKLEAMVRDVCAFLKVVEDEDRQIFGNDWTPAQGGLMDDAESIRVSLETALSIPSTKDSHDRTDQVEAPKALAHPDADGRFFIDHGVVHDRKTGQHVGMEAEPEHAERLLALLNELTTSPLGVGNADPRPPMEHKVKTWPDQFEAILKGIKRHEVRKFDRDYRYGDTFTAQEYDPQAQSYSGRESRHLIGYVTAPGLWGLPADIGVLSLCPTLPSQGNSE